MVWNCLKYIPERKGNWEISVLINQEMVDEEWVNIHLVGGLFEVKCVD